MNRRKFARTGAVAALVAGLVMLLSAASYLLLRPSSAEEAWTYSAPSGGYALILSALYLGILVLPGAILLSVLGLYALVGQGSTAGRWGLVLCVAATLLWAVGYVLPYFYFLVSSPTSDSGVWTMFVLQTALYALQSVLLASALVLLYLAARRRGTPGRWTLLIPALACAVVLYAALPFAASEVGLHIDEALSRVLSVVCGLLWMALGVAIWRHAPDARPHQIPTVPANL